MATPTSTGMNRTGMDMAPLLADRMLEITKEHPVQPGDETALARLRREFATTSHPVGTVPPPMSVKGAATAAVEMIKGHKPTVLIDKLGERLAFERTGVRLYEGVLVKFDAFGSWDGGPAREQLEQIRDEELEHFHLIKDYMQRLGVDPTAMTPAADVTAVIASGVLKAVTDARTTLPQALNAMLVAERADVEGWQLLIQLADELGQGEMAGQFREAEQVEERHALWVRGWLATAVLQDAHLELKGGQQG